MRTTFLLLLLSFLTLGSTSAQTSDLVFFTDDGEPFVLVLDGQVINETPASRVVATGVRNETPLCVIRFSNTAIPQLKKGGYFPAGKEYTVVLTTNKKGERVFRSGGEAALGTAAAKEVPTKPRPAAFTEDAASDRPAMTQPVEGQEVTTVKVVETSTQVPEDGSVRMNLGINGVGVNMDIQVQDGMDATGVSTTTTTTTTTTTGSTRQQVTAREVEKPVHTMPGYTGEVGCAHPMTEAEFSSISKSIADKSFEDTKVTLAKQIARDRCFSAEQVTALLGLFSFEDNKLDLAKFCYDHTYDKSNYYKVNDAFSFESTIDELNSFLEGR